MKNENENLLSRDFTSDDSNSLSLRPKKLSEFIGQNQIKGNLQIFINAAKERGDALDHVLFYGPPGLGKTTLSHIIAKEMESGIKTTSGPMLTKTGDLAAILTNLQRHDVLLIDEIHRMNSSVEELLYSAMEDMSIDVIIGEGAAARAIKINLERFTLVGATTRLGLLSSPLRDRFGIPIKLDFYSEDELNLVIKRASKLLCKEIENDALEKLAKCARGTPRIAVRLLRRIRDFADNLKSNIITNEIVNNALKALGVDSLGLNDFDYKYINYINDFYNGGPVGIETIAAGLAEDISTIEDTIEPYLMQIGFIARTPRGRELTAFCMQHLKQGRK